MSVTSKYREESKLPEKEPNVSTALTPPREFVCQENLEPAFGLPMYPTELNEPKVKPVAVGGVEGSVVPDSVVTDAKSYVFVTNCANTSFAIKRKMRTETKMFFICTGVLFIFIADYPSRFEKMGNVLNKSNSEWKKIQKIIDE